MNFQLKKQIATKPKAINRKKLVAFVLSVIVLSRKAPLEISPQTLHEYFVSKGMCCYFAIHDPNPPGKYDKGSDFE